MSIDPRQTNDTAWPSDLGAGARDRAEEPLHHGAGTTGEEVTPSHTSSGAIVGKRTPPLAVARLAESLHRKGMVEDLETGLAEAWKVMGRNLRSGVRGLGAIRSGPPKPLLIDRLHPAGHTIMFGAGGCGKGVLTSHWVVLLVRAGFRVLVIDYENHPDEWSCRIRALDPSAFEDVLHVCPVGSGWTAGPIWEHADQLGKFIRWNAIDLVVVDSIVPACGSADVTKPETAGRYAEAVARLGVPVLSLGHVTKEGDLRYPFGSAFWHNLARVTWSVTKTNATGHQMDLVCRKNNNGPLSPRTLVTVEWDNGLPRRVTEQAHQASLADLCDEVLMGGPLSFSDLLDRLRGERPDVKEDSVRRALTRGTDRFIQRGGLWSRSAAGQDTPRRGGMSVQLDDEPTDDTGRTSVGQDHDGDRTDPGQNVGQRRRGVDDSDWTGSWTPEDPVLLDEEADDDADDYSLFAPEAALDARSGW